MRMTGLNIFLLTLGLCLQPGTDIMAQSADSQQLNRDFYDSRLLQLEFLQQQSGIPDSSFIYLKQEAGYFARQKDWETALDLVNQALEIVRAVPETEITEKETVVDPLVTFPSGWQWTLEMGSDYSRQEYEMSFIESDSVVLEQLHNPFLALRFSRQGKWKSDTYQFFNYFRGDNELLQSSSSLALESSDYSHYWRLETQSDLFWQYREEQGSFWENQLRADWNRQIGSRQRLIFYSQARYKLHFPADSTYGNVLSGELAVALRHYLHYLSWLEISFRPSYYNENQLLGLRYMQIQSQVELQHRLDFNLYFTAQLNHYYRNFRSRQPDGDRLNSYHRVQPVAEAELPVFHPFGIAAKAEGEWRWYGSPNASYSNFNFASLSASLKYYLGNYNSVGIGYVYESETHRTTQADERSLVEQENFHAGGILLSLDIMQQSGFMISLTYKFTLRTYPNAGADDVFGYYSNRRIHSIQGIGYLPLSSHWQFQLFANYDNDRDRDREANDNFSTIFNLGLSYKF